MLLLKVLGIIKLENKIQVKEKRVNKQSHLGIILLKKEKKMFYILTMIAILLLK